MSIDHLKNIVNKLIKALSKILYKLVISIFVHELRMEKVAAKQAHPPINILIFNKLFLPNFSIAGHNNM